MRFVSQSAQNHQRRVIERGLESCPIGVVPQLGRHLPVVVGNASVGGNDGMADDLDCHPVFSLDIAAGVLHM